MQPSPKGGGLLRRWAMLSNIPAPKERKVF